MTTSAKIIADSISPTDNRIITLQLRYPKFIHGEFLTHRVFSRNSSSSRAIPVDRLIKDVLEDPVVPDYWGKNQKGMQAEEECRTQVYFGFPLFQCLSREKAWLHARDLMVTAAKNFSDAGYHKQIINRLLEPWAHINTVVTSTEWNNFFSLRDHPSAQPEIQVLAQQMRAAIDASVPTLRTASNPWHLPYIVQDDFDYVGTQEQMSLRFISAARCARVSHVTHDFKTPNPAEDLALAEKLLNENSMSPFEHQAMVATVDNPETLKVPLWGNFKGWVQSRKLIEQGELTHKLVMS